MKSTRILIGVLALSVAAVSQADYFGQYGNVTTAPGGPNGTAYRLTSDNSLGTAWAGVYYVADPGMTLNDLTTASTDFSFLQGRFGGGAPRFSIGLTNNTEIHVYWGSLPNFDDTPTPGWQNTGNLLASPDNRFDTAQEAGGLFYDNAAHMYAAYGTMGVDYVSLDLDGGWAVPGGIQQMDVTNFEVNGNFIPVPEPASMAILGIGALALIRKRRA